MRRDARGPSPAKQTGVAAAKAKNLRTSTRDMAEATLKTRQAGTGVPHLAGGRNVAGARRYKGTWPERHQWHRTVHVQKRGCVQERKRGEERKEGKRRISRLTWKTAGGETALTRACPGGEIRKGCPGDRLP